MLHFLNGSIMHTYLNILMQRLLFIITFLILSNNFVIAQSNELYLNRDVVNVNPNLTPHFSNLERSMLQTVFGVHLQDHLQRNPLQELFFKDIFRNRVIVKNIDNPRDQKSCPLLSEVPLFNYFVKGLKRDKVFNPLTFNPLKYKFPFYSKNTTIFRVDGTNYFIFIRPQNYFKNH